LKQNTIAIIEVNKFSAPPPLKETQNTATLTSASQLKEAEEKTVAEPTPAASKNPALPEQTPVGASVAMSVPPAPKVKEKETAVPAVSTIPRTEELPLTKIYRVGPNDVLDIRLNDSSQQSTLFTVTATGLLEHPLFVEPMSVAGLTVEEIGTRIDEDLRKRAIIENPKAVVGVRDYASHAVLVSGLVKDAGTKFLRREAIPLYVVVADAQPLPEAAKVSVVRNESNEIHEIDLNQAADMNFLVRSGDVVTLSPHTTQFVYIGGEVKFPGEKTFRRGLTLMQVILSAGGAGPKAKIAEISRDDGNGFLVPTRFTLKEIVSGKAMDPTLKPGDRISILR
jgi:protein involved in polysaccharide export with SLBB domain